MEQTGKKRVFSPRKGEKYMESNSDLDYEIKQEPEQGQEPVSKKARMESSAESSKKSSPKISNPVLSPATRKRTIKVIPPKDPKDSSSPSRNSSPPRQKQIPLSTTIANLRENPSEISAGTVDESTTTTTTIATSTSAIATSTSNIALAVTAHNSDPIKTSANTSPINSPKKDSSKPNDTCVVVEQDDRKSKNRFNMLSRMQFDMGIDKVLKEIEKTQEVAPKRGIVVNDSRLLMTNHPNYNISMGNLTYTGANSRSSFSSRAADLDLFLFPRFTSKNHYCTIEVRVPAELLTHRGNIAVRKNAIWGTEIYTDDSDVVAMIIHSGHYRPVDAPDPTVEAGPSAPVNATKSSVRVVSPIHTDIIPVVAQPDPAISSTNILIPDHDLAVNLRILPRLVKYTGSTRWGLESKCWGGLHDGESIQIVSVQKLARSTVSKEGRKKFVRGIEYPGSESQKTILFNPNGQSFLKYTPSLLTSWPPYLRAYARNAYYPGLTKLPFDKDGLVKHECWPFWRILITKYQVILHGQVCRYLVAGVTGAVSILDSKKRPLYQGLKPELIEFTEMGLTVHNAERIEIPFDGVSWI